MPKTNWDKTIDVPQAIVSFLDDQQIPGEPDFSLAFPDCLVRDSNLIIEETSVMDFKLERPKNPDPSLQYKEINGYQKYWIVEEDSNITPEKIIEAIEVKEAKEKYKSFPQQYEQRILLIRINARRFDRKNIDVIAQPAYYAAVKLAIFTSVFLCIYPFVPTREDIDKVAEYFRLNGDSADPIRDNIFPSRKIKFFKIL